MGSVLWMINTTMLCCSDRILMRWKCCRIDISIRKGSFLSEQHPVVHLHGEEVFSWATKHLSVSTGGMEATKVTRKVLVFIHETKRR